MRIGFDAKRLYGNFTGLGNYSRALLRDLGEFYPDHDYYLYAPSAEPTPETNFFLKSTDYHTYLHQGRLKSLWRSYSMVGQLKTDRVELYHGLSHELPINIRRSGIKSIVTIHDLIFRIYPNTYPALDRTIYNLKFKHSCRYADRIVAISNNTKNDIVNYYGIPPDKIDVVYQSCNPLYYRTGETAKNESIIRQYKLPSEYLLYVGSITKRKNLKTVIESYKQLPSDCRIPWLIVGNGGSYKKEVMELAVAKGLENLVIWMDDIANNEHLSTIYQHAMALVYPSLYEGFGLPVVEGLLSKTPVITSNVSSLPEAGGPRSIYIDPNNPDALADAIQQVLCDSELRETMKHAGYVYATQKFSRQTVTEQMIHLYQKTLHS